MKRASLVLALVSISCTFALVHGQRTGDATLVDSMGEFGCDDLQLRLDLLALDVSTTPGAVGFAVVYPGENPFVNAAYERGIKFNSAFRNFPAHLVQPVWGPVGSSLKIETWKVTGSTSPPARTRLRKCVVPWPAAAAVPHQLRQRLAPRVVRAVNQTSAATGPPSRS